MAETIKTNGRLPDFLIIGASRCGTSSLFINLLQHPKIMGPYHDNHARPYKEVYFFNRLKNYNNGIEWYKSLFSEVPEDSLCFEASTAYLFDLVSAQRISKHLPEGKFIVLLRNPVDRAISFLSRWDAGKRDTWNIDELKDPKYARVFGVYAKALNIWFSYYSRDRFLIIKSEDYFEDEKKAIAQCFEYLGLEAIDIGTPRFFDVRWMSKDYNITSGQKRIKVPDDVKEYLREFFKPHNQDLSELLGRDFGWQ